MKRQPKKLVLAKETVALLTEDLRAVQGGTASIMVCNGGGGNSATDFVPYESYCACDSRNC